jgi:predicted Rossmann fold nucleotide-binding protein DprA/Smf involved in DNA uptake
MAVIDDVLKALLARHGELAEQLPKLQEEHDRVAAAIVAARGAPTPASQNSGRRSRPVGKPGAQPGARRAPRGQNRAQILEAVRECPRTLDEIVSMTGIKRQTVSVTCSQMVKAGLMTRDAARRYSAPKPRSAGRARATARKAS